jgi:hypothetical protein
VRDNIEGMINTGKVERGINRERIIERLEERDNKGII